MVYSYHIYTNRFYTRLTMQNVFSSFKDFEKFLIKETGCRVFQDTRISYRKHKKLCILKSEDVSYYDDIIEKNQYIQYTLYGQIGDQSINTEFNMNFLDHNKTEKIFIYKKTQNEWIWLGRYEIMSLHEKIHPDKNGKNRKILYVKMKLYENNENSSFDIRQQSIETVREKKTTLLLS